jgi:hypothetical protein
MIGVGYVLYRLIRAEAAGREDVARHNADLLVAFTPGAVRDVETYLNAATSAREWLADGTALYYTVLHLPMTAGTLLWLWIAKPWAYGRARTALVVVSLIGLAGFWLTPMLPPRLYNPELGDTALEFARSRNVGDGDQPSGFVNDYAAFPSLHFAWACWVAWSVRPHLPTGVGAAVWLYPGVTAVVLVATANHYVGDLVAGAGALVVSVALTDFVGGRWQGIQSGPAAAGASP